MYESFFGLTKLPFKITPDPEFIYWNRDHRRAASIIAFGIEQTVPITVVTGDIGTGKTTLIQQFLDDAPTDTTVGLISNFWSGMGGLYQWILNAFDIDASGSEVEQFRRFQDYVISEYAAGRRCVLIVDEAQNVSDPDLEQLRMLTNINSGKDSLLMLFLVGQQQLRDRLMEPQNRQIAQRVGAAFHLGPMSHEDTAKYVRHRITVAGGTRDIFDDSALARIHEVAGGVPRMINVVCELALVTAFGDGVDSIDASYIDEFLEEAQANGMIAHLPLSPQTEAPPPPLPVETPPLPQVSRRGPSRAWQGQQRIRLVSEQEERAAEAREEAAQLPAAEKPETVPDPARRMERAMASSLDRSAKTQEAESIAGAAQEEPAEETPTIEPEAQPALVEGVVSSPSENEPAATPLAAKPENEAAVVWRGRTLAALDHGLDAALVIMGAGAILASVAANTERSAPEAAIAPPAPSVNVADAVPAAPERSSPAPLPIIPLDNPSGAELMDRALTSGAADPAQAAIDYARAALRGEARAAYYLGQLFETGDGVNRDIALARAWYGHAADSVRSARRRMADLPVPDQGIVLAPPVPQLGGPRENGAAEFVWTSGNGADPALYMVELAGPDLAQRRRLPAQNRSAQQIDDIGNAAKWRVIAADPGLGLYSVSAWQDMGAAAEPVTGQQGKMEVEATPQITLHLSETGGAALESEVRQAFPTASVSTVARKEQATAPGVEFAYEADAPLATRLAEMMGGGLTARRAVPRAPDAEPPLPGDLEVFLP